MLCLQPSVCVGAGVYVGFMIGLGAPVADGVFALDSGRTQVADAVG